MIDRGDSAFLMKRSTDGENSSSAWSSFLVVVIHFDR